jgi:hypothetical protein
VRSFIKIVLLRFGYRVVEAAVAEAPPTLPETPTAPIHLLLTDIALPDS